MASSPILQTFLALITLILGVSAFYESGDVISLTPSNFDSKLKNGVWLVEFYAPWCGHCQQLAPVWKEVSSALKGIVNVGAVDADAHGSLAQQYSIKGFPTIMAMTTDSSGKIKSATYQGGRTAKEIIQWAMSQAEKVALKRIGAKPSGGSSRSSSSSGGGGSAGNDNFFDGSPVVSLTDANFHSQVIDSDDQYFVMFYAPWCGHCKNLKPTWAELSKNLDEKVKVAAVDCTEQKATCSEFGVQGFPTIKFFGTNKERPESYEGGRDLASLTSYATERWQKNQPPPEVRELIDQETWEEHCLGHDANEALDLKGVKPKQLCLVAFLPHILDSKSKGRNAAIDMLKELSLRYKDRPFSWFWAEGGSQPKLEANMDIGGFGFPAFVALSPSKGKYATLKGAFEADALKEFMDSVRSGGSQTYNINGELSAIEQRDPWNGEDAAAEAEEEFSLEDLGIGGGSDGEL